MTSYTEQNTFELKSQKTNFRYFMTRKMFHRTLIFIVTFFTYPIKHQKHLYGPWKL